MPARNARRVRWHTALNGNRAESSLWDNPRHRRRHALPPLRRYGGAPTSAHIMQNDDDPVSRARATLATAQHKSLLFTRPGFLIRRLHQIHSALFLEETREFGVTPVQYSLLTALSQHGEMEQGTLALEIGLERTSVAEVIPRLQERGLIERRQAPQDKRVKRVRLTRKGRNLVNKMAPAVQRAHDRSLDPLPPEERDLFMLKLIQLVEASHAPSAVPLRLRARKGGEEK